MTPVAARALEIGAALRDAQADFALAEAGLAAAREEHERALDRASIDDALAAQPRIAEAATLVEIARRLVERLDAEHTEACQGAADAAALAERERLRVEAEEAARRYEAAFRADMPEVVACVRKVLRRWAEAEIAREAAADAGVVLPAVDAFRHVPGRPRENLRSWERDLWLRPADGEPYDDARQARVKVQADGSGRLYGPAHTTTVTKKRRFRFTEHRPRIDSAIAPLLARELCIPALFANEQPGYLPPIDRHDARAVLARLDALDQAPAKPPTEPMVKVEPRPIEPPRDVVVRRDPPAAAATRAMSGF